jgi:hypothetical protein
MVGWISGMTQHGVASWRGLGLERYVGVLMFCDFDSVAYVYVWMDVDPIFVFVFAYVGP